MYLYPVSCICAVVCVAGVLLPGLPPNPPPSNSARVHPGTSFSQPSLLGSLVLPLFLSLSHVSNSSPPRAPHNRVRQGVGGHQMDQRGLLNRPRRVFFPNGFGYGGRMGVRGSPTTPHPPCSQIADQPFSNPILMVWPAPPPQCWGRAGRAGAACAGWMAGGPCPRGCICICRGRRRRPSAPTGSDVRTRPGTWGGGLKRGGPPRSLIPSPPTCCRGGGRFGGLGVHKWQDTRIV